MVADRFGEDSEMKAITDSKTPNAMRTLMLGLGIGLVIYAFLYFAMVRVERQVFVGVGPWRCQPSYIACKELSRRIFYPAHMLDRVVRYDVWRDYEDGDDLAERIR